MTSTEEEKQHTQDEIEEKKYFEKCIRCFRFYRKHALQDVRKAITDFKALPEAHRAMLPNFYAQQTTVMKCIDVNYMFILHMLHDVADMFLPPELEEEAGEDDAACKTEQCDITEKKGSGSTTTSDKVNDSDCENTDDKNTREKCKNLSISSDQDHHSHKSPNRKFTNAPTDTGEGLTMGDMDRVYTTLRQYVRDWAAEGAGEREKCYRPIIDAVTSRYPDGKLVEILVPGAGLGRLAFDFASLGYNSEGNEFSMYMLIGANYILNKMTGPGMVHLYPWATTSTNNLKHMDRIARVNVPDVDTTKIPQGTRFGMSAGDFLEVYGKQKNRFDVVASSFFLDTAHNIVEYLQTIYQILKPGGRLISLGPLLFHYAGMSDQISMDELPSLLQPSRPITVRQGACDLLLGVTNDKSTISQIISDRNILSRVWDCLSDEDKKLSVTAANILVNLTAEQYIPDAHVIPSLLAMFHSEKAFFLYNGVAMILNNISRAGAQAEILVGQIYPADCQRFVGILAQGKEQGYLAGVLGNIALSGKGRELLVREDVLPQLIGLLTYPGNVLVRRNIARLLRNLAFDVKTHSALSNHLPQIVYPMCGGEELDEDDMEKLPLDLQYLPDDKEREPDLQTRVLISDTLFQMGSSYEVREEYRKWNYYVLFREYDRWEQDDDAREAMQNVIYIIIQDDGKVDLRKEHELPTEVETPDSEDVVKLSDSLDNNDILDDKATSDISNTQTSQLESGS